MSKEMYWRRLAALPGPEAHVAALFPRPTSGAEGTIVGDMVIKTRCRGSVADDYRKITSSRLCWTGAPRHQHLQLMRWDELR